MWFIIIVVVRNATNICECECECVCVYVLPPVVSCCPTMLLLALVNSQLLDFQVFGCICFLATESVVKFSQKPKVNGKGKINSHTCT